MSTDATPIRYDIIDRQTGYVVGTAKTHASATRAVAVYADAVA